MKRKLFTYVFSLLIGQVFGQENLLDTLAEKFSQYRSNSLQEKTFVHTDRNFYVTGESLWFRVFVADGTFHKPLGVSKVAYVEIIDRNNISVAQAKVELREGGGAGSLFLPATLLSSNYEIRAYTQWMKNTGPEFFFRKQITIVNPFVKTESQKKETLAAHSVAFFPEGGNLVSQVRSKIAFRITDSEGRGLSAKGAVIGASGDTVTRFKTERNGLGYFFHTPSGNHNDKVTFVDSAGLTSTQSLPIATLRGFVMALRDSGEYLRLEVRTNSPDNSPIYLFSHARQLIGHFEAKSAGALTVFTIDKKKIEAGITHITLFNSKLEPVCERLFFRYPDNSLDLKIEIDKLAGTRRKVKALLAANAVTGIADLSVSVFKLDSLSTIEENDIFSYFWLTSDLKGEIESPGYYFSKEGKATNAIDLVMLTHGWRRFKWEDILTRKPVIKFVPEYRTHIVQGSISNRNGKPIAGAVTYLSSPGKIVRLYPSISDSHGRVRFEVSDFYGSRKVIAQTPADSTFNVQIADPFYSGDYKTDLPPLLLSSTMRKSLLDRSVAMQISDIYHEGQRERYVLPNIDSAAFFGSPDETFLLDDFTRFPVMEEVMREYVPGVMVRIRRDGFNFLVQDDVNKTVMKETPMILIDGVPLFDADEIMSFDPRRIKKLEVVRRPYYLGPTLLHGIVSYTTYEGDLSTFKLKEGKTLIDYDGLHLQREFYKPAYNTVAERNSRIPDRRNLLYWNPSIKTDQSGKASIEFFTSDIEGEYTVEVQGTTSKGALGSGHTSFRVKDFNN